MVVEKVYLSPPNAKVVGYHDNLFDLSNCSNYATWSSSSLEAYTSIGRIPGLFRIMTASPIGMPDIQTCTFADLGGVALQTAKATSSLTKAGSYWTLKFTATQLSGPDPIDIWTGEKFSAVPTGFAGYYERISGCVENIKRLKIIKSSKEPCPCPPFSFLDCNYSSLKIANFNPFDWIPPLSDLVGEPPSIRFLCNTDWDGTVDGCGAQVAPTDTDPPTTPCYWAGEFEDQFTGCVWRHTPRCPSGISALLVDYGPPQIWVPVESYITNSPAGWAVKVVAGTRPHDVGWGVYVKEYDDSPQGTYIKISDRRSWQLARHFLFDPDCSRCYCNLGPDTVEIV